MSLISDYILDGALERLQEADELWIFSGADEPVDYAAALAVRCGIKTAPEIGAPVDGTVSGRKVVVSAFNDGTPTVQVTATRWGLVDTVGEKYRMMSASSETQTVSSSALERSLTIEFIGHT